MPEDKYKERKNKLKVKSTKGDRTYSSSKDYLKDKQMKRAEDWDNRLLKSDDKTLKNWSKTNALPKTNMWTGKVTQDTKVKDNKSKLATQELKRRENAKKGTGGRRAGLDSMGGHR